MTRQSNVLRALNILKVACAGAMLCSALLGASWSLISGAEPSSGAQVFAALAGAVAAGMGKALSLLS